MIGTVHLLDEIETFNGGAIGRIKWQAAQETRQVASASDSATSFLRAGDPTSVR